MDDFKTMLGANMRMARDRQGLTQEQVAESVGLPADIYARMEQGVTVPRLELFVTLCNKLGATPNQLLGFADTRPEQGSG